MLYQDPVKDIDIEKQTLTTNSGKHLKYGSLIIATGSSASRFPEKIGKPTWRSLFREVADADALISSLGKAKKVVVVGGGYKEWRLLLQQLLGNLIQQSYFPRIISCKDCSLLRFPGDMRNSTKRMVSKY
ncbi:Monodehydroascorbate reductase 5 [Arachis hypogaea]|nr:Monodehydroascorbate reductase 5 [Arachis hypogaea]